MQKKLWILNTLPNGVRLAHEKSIIYHAEKTMDLEHPT